MSERICLPATLDDYSLLDFGHGRRLERLGPYVVDRPDARATGEPAMQEWQADWSWHRVGAAGRWQAGDPALPRSWSMRLDGQEMTVQLRDDGSTGVEPELIACRRWVREQLSGCYHLGELRVLNLFAGSGSVTGAALDTGASVVHVEADGQLLALAQRHIDSPDVEWLHDNATAVFERCLREQRDFDLMIVRPRAWQRGPGSQSWDIDCDLTPLVAGLPRLASPHCRGVWLSLQDRSWSVDSLAQMLRDAFPGRRTRSLEIGLTSADGRELVAATAACWHDDEDHLQAADGLPPLSAERIEERLDVPLDPILSSRRTASGPARALADCTRAQQDFVFRWVDITARTNAEMAYQFASHAARAFTHMDEAGVEAWLIDAMDAYDVNGLHAGMKRLQAVDEFAAGLRDSDTGCRLEDVAGLLEKFVHGLHGRKLQIDSADQAWSDSETVCLPETLSRLPDRAQNFTLYKAMLVHQWALGWYGLFNLDLEAVLANAGDAGLAMACLHRLESIRTDALLARDLPGIRREMRALEAQLGQALVPTGWEHIAAELQQAGSNAADSARLLDAAIATGVAPDPLVWEGGLRPQQVARARAARIARQKNEWQTLLARLQNEIGPEAPEPEPETNAGSKRFRLRQAPESTDEQPVFELEYDGRVVPPTAEIESLMTSIVQDFGDIPPEYLVPAGDGAWSPAEAESDPSQDVWKGAYHEEGAWHYNEWDCKRGHYRKNWCVLREIDISPQPDAFFHDTLRRYSALVKDIRRTFEALRGEEKLLKRQLHGDDIDIDALVEAHADVRSGMEMTDRLFTKRHKLERNIAVMFMIDMSGSTKGWINDAERESLILLCEALETLGDRYAIYGFSGMTRKRCELYRIKRFDDAYDDTVHQRICNITPRDYTRMGVTIRHLTHLLEQVEARTRLLITLSDGKPDDFDGYRGEYGIEDTRMALIEARRSGIHPFCITIDSQAHDYLPHMYGAVNYTVVDDVRKLPLRVSDIYRRLTT